MHMHYIVALPKIIVVVVVEVVGAALLLRLWCYTTPAACTHRGNTVRIQARIRARAERRPQKHAVGRNRDLFVDLRRVADAMHW